VKFGDTVRTEMMVTETRPSSKPDRGVVVFDVAVKNQRDETVCSYQETVLMRRKRG
jgi:acyl dehydratase